MMMSGGLLSRLLLLLLLGLDRRFVSSSSLNDEDISALDAVSDIVERISLIKDWNIDDVQISNIDSETVRFTKATVYELDIRIGDQILPAKFIDEVAKWQHLGNLEKTSQEQDCQGKVLKVLWGSKALRSVLNPFQLNGPVGLSFKSSKTLQNSSQEEKQITNLNLTIGSSVEVEGAQEVSLTHPVELPLPFNQSSPIRSLATGILSLLTKHRNHSVDENDRNFLSLHIKGSTMIASINMGLEPRDIAPPRMPESDFVKLLYNDDGEESKSTLHSSKVFDKSSMWPFPLLNVSNPRFLVLDEIMKVYLRSSSHNKSVSILRAKVAASTFVLFEFEIERKLSQADFDPEVWPHWRIRPNVERHRYQVLAKIRDNKISPISVQPLKQYKNVDTHIWRDDVSNVSYTSFSSYLAPSNAMTLDVD